MGSERSAQVSRRSFCAVGAGGIVAAGCGPKQPPNIVWVVSEDNGPFLGCYGDDYAETPNLDRMAAAGVRYENAFATYPVCAPARCSLITGVHPESLGTGHMRSNVAVPAHIRMFPGLLREAGYYTTNNSKTDYNTGTQPGTWDESSNQATYRGRAPEQPFFHQVNIGITHESSLFKQHDPKHDPALAPVPPYHPDTPTFRTDWARYYDHVTRMDEQVGRILSELEEDGVAQNTIVFYFSDHGGVLPRTKRYVADSGVRVPLIVRFPERFRHLAPAGRGESVNRLVSFVDFAPTALHLAGLPRPEYMQGVSFLGEERREFVFLAQDRMGPCPDLVRAVSDGRRKYVRNYLPQLPKAQFETYTLDMPSWVEIRSLFEAGRLDDAQRQMFEPKELEELYDTVLDPHEVNNIASERAAPRLRDALRKHLLEIRDAGFIPEIEMHRLAVRKTPFEVAQDPEAYPLERILEVAESTSLDELMGLLEDDNTVVQYWAAVGCSLLGKQAKAAVDVLRSVAEGSPSDAARMQASEALCRIGHDRAALNVLAGYLQDDRQWVRFTAAIHVARLGKLASGIARDLEAALDKEEERYPKLAMEQAVRSL